MHEEDTLASIMSSPPIAVAASAPLREALRLMVRHDIGAVLVEGSDGIDGICTERDIVKLLAEGLPGALEQSVASSLPARRLVTAPPEASPVRALELMARHDIRRVPVSEHGRVVGLVTERDAVKWLLRRPEVILDMLSATQPAVARDALVALVREMHLKPQL